MPAPQSRLRDMKTCPDCNTMKPLDDFPPAKKRSDGRATYCRPCMRERHKAHYRERQAARGKAVREPTPEGTKRCPDCREIKPLEAFPLSRSASSGRHPYCKPCHNARGKGTIARLYGTSRHYHLVRRYGISAADADRMLEEQNGLCAICTEKPAEHVDHCHDSGRVRGLLCFNCNGGLGQFGDRVDILSRAIDYLERTRDPLWLSSDFTDGFPLPSLRPEAAPSPTSSEESPPIC
jgi:hypothetical protein